MNVMVKTGRSPMAQLIERSSLGTTEARRIRSLTPPEVVIDIVAGSGKADRHAASTAIREPTTEFQPVWFQLPGPGRHHTTSPGESLMEVPNFSFMTSPVPEIGSIVKLNQAGDGHLLIKIDKIISHQSGSVMISGTIVDPSTIVESPRAMTPGIVYEHSTDYGRSWKEIALELRAPIIVLLADLEPNEVYDDGMNNLYRWTWRQHG